MRELSADEVLAISGGSKWGDNVLKYASAGALLGSFGGPKGAAAGIIVGSLVGTVVTVVG
jgi:hypothetical protein